MKKIMKGVSCILAIVVFAACSKNDSTMVTPALTVKTVKNLMADTIIGFAPSGQPYGSGKYSFYSLENNTLISSSDSNSTKWDLGFRGTSIITNSGNSGPAKGGAFVYVGVFDDLKTVPADSVFRTDNAPSAYAITSGSGRGWYSYNAPVNLVTPIPGRVLVIRTASGKYAKVEILNYYKGGITPDASAPDAVKLSEQRYYTLRYIFQSNGTTTF
jgi:hypothetical protein